MINFIYTGIITFIIMLLLHHLYNYLQSNLTIPKVNQINTTIVHDLNEIKQELKNKDDNKEIRHVKDDRKDELKEYLNQFKKK
jgi:hypothetical protein